MTQAIIFTNSNGGVSVCIPTGELPIEAVLEKDCPKDADARIVNLTDLPQQDNDFFDAWEMTNGEVTVNFTKAQEITKRRLRAEREPLLAAQDVLFQRALEGGALASETAPIVAEKNRLRDITKLADIAESLAALRAISVGA